MRGMSLERIAQAAGGRLYAAGYDTTGRDASAVVIDSRKIEDGAVFVATRGERVDGHDFIGDVFEKGALGVICEKLPNGKKAGEPDAAEGLPGPCILVEDSFKALKKVAAYYREQMAEVRIVGIVGSVGKTSTKELVASVIGESFNTLKTEGNFNNEVGVPLTILRLRDGHEAAVIEMGISNFGEMDRLGTIVKPDAVVMTNIGPCHLEFLKDLDGVLKAKSEVFNHITGNGLLALNSEDEKLNTVREEGRFRIKHYGNGGDVSAADIRSLGLEGSEFTVKYKNADGSGLSFETKVPLPGRHMVQNALAATVIGLEFGMTPEKIAEGIESVKPVSGRSNLIHTEKYLIVDDCYNANPKSMKAAVDLMTDALGRRCAILGDMFELGSDAPALHAETGTYAAEHGIDLLICCGELSRNMYDAAVKANPQICAKYYTTRDELLESIDKAGFRTGDTILVKASHGMGFADVIKSLEEQGK